MSNSSPADQFQRDSFTVTPDISPGVLGNVPQAVLKAFRILTEQTVSAPEWR